MRCGPWGGDGGIPCSAVVYVRDDGPHMVVSVNRQPWMYTQVVQMSELRGKVVLVTGSSSGIGAAIAVEFAKHGVRLALTGRNVIKLQETARLCQEVGLPASQLLIVTGDVMLDEDIKRIVGSVVQHFGTLQILVNNAGGTIKRSWTTLQWQDFDYVMRLNTKSGFMISREAAPHLIDNKGCIINVSSVGGLRGSPVSLAYCCSKAAVDTMTRLMALELGPLGVRVNSINPGHIRDTDLFMSGGVITKPEQMDNFVGGYLPFYPLGRVGKTSDVGPVAVFLCSKQASFVHGINMPIDGGHLTDPRIAGYIE